MLQLSSEGNINPLLNELSIRSCYVKFDDDMMQIISEGNVHPVLNELSIRPQNAYVGVKV
jgi:hypothetical protein